MSRLTVQETLQEIFNFTDDDLVANRNGRRTRAQQWELYKDLPRMVVGYIGIAIITFFGSLWSFSGDPIMVNVSFKTFLLIYVGCMILLGLLFIGLGFQTLITIWNQRVDRTRGLLRISPENRVKVGKRLFDMFPQTMVEVETATGEITYQSQPSARQNKLAQVIAEFQPEVVIYHPPNNRQILAQQDLMWLTR